jgi:hypothetical protein
MYEVRSGNLYVKVVAESPREAAKKGLCRFEGKLSDVLEVTKDGSTSLFSVKTILDEMN